MPELPEVETVARQLHAVLPGRRLVGLQVLDEGLAHLRGDFSRVREARFGAVRRVGKQVAMSLDIAGSGRHWLLVHLRMTGRLLLLESGAATPAYTRCRLELDAGALCFADSRRFGTVVVASGENPPPPPGLDPLDALCTPRRLLEMGANSRPPIKAWLLDQHRLCGLGNIYACEILHAAALSPRRPAQSLLPADWKRLHGDMVRILGKAIALCGTTFSDFQDSRGVEGSFGKLLRVYRRQGLACHRCGGTIQRESQSQRGTYWCPDCQH